MWLNAFESDTLVEDLDNLWQEVEPLYKELHFYVSRKLKTRYQDDLDLSDRLIPAHVLGIFLICQKCVENNIYNFRKYVGSIMD